MNRFVILIFIFSASYQLNEVSAHRLPRVMGGEDATPGEFPWRCNMVTKPPNSKSGMQCGCSIISPNWILTAAHCCNSIQFPLVLPNPSNVIPSPFPTPNPTVPPAPKNPVPAAWVTITVGDHDRKVEESEEKKHTVSKVVMYEGYDSRTIDGDICLLQLSQSVAYTKTVQAIALPWNYNNDTFDGKVATVSGWGVTAPNGDPARILQKADLTVISNEVCNNEENYDGMVTDNMICAYAEGKSAGSGDSGGSIDWKDDGVYTPIGVVSWGATNGKRPSVFTRVTKFLQWIKDTTNEF